MFNEPKDTIIRARVPAALRLRLERIAQRSVARDLSDHIRVALERYVVAEEEAAQTPAPVALEAAG